MKINVFCLVIGITVIVALALFVIYNIGGNTVQNTVQNSTMPVAESSSGGGVPNGNVAEPNLTERFANETYSLTVGEGVGESGEGSAGQ
ncbi:MAG: hypothetical protein PHC66_04685 [Candidatus Nanoarchaeia archaeon]|nr:hypothetical protein [Candidatus Nanoarchaeia archaeon]MDD5239480.1 hypothetical protein [Candidatus Nanoarchaeia archaeon]